MAVQVSEALAAGAAAVVTGTAIPVPMEPIVAAATITRVMNEGLVHIESSGDIGRGQKPAAGNSTAQAIPMSLFRVSAQASFSYTLTVRNS